MSSDADVLRAFLQLFQWVFEVEFPPAHSRAIEHEVRVGWANQDPSERELVAYVLDTYTLITRTPAAGHAKRRAQAKQIFERMFSKAEANDRGRVVAAIHRAIESLRPGASGVPIPGRSVAFAPSSYGPSPQLGYPPGHPALTASQPHTPQQLGYPPAHMQPPPHHVGYAAAAPPPDPHAYAAQSAMQRLIDEQREAQRVTMESNIAAIRHQAAMTVIGNIK